MSVGIPSSNPTYSLDSVLQSQLRGFTEPGQTASTTAPGAAVGLATYNNLPSSAGDDVRPETLPAPTPAVNIPVTSNAGSLATSTTASVLTAGGRVSVRVVDGSAAQITFTNSSTGEKSVIGTTSAGLSTNLNGTNVTSGNLTTNDVGVYASAQDAPTTPGTFNPAFSVKSGATQGSTTSAGVTSDQVSYSALTRANTDAGHLSSFISQYA